MAGGKGAAYQRLRPLQGDITNDLLNAEDQEFKHRAEDRLIADRKAKAEADKQAKAQQGLSKAKALKLYDTKSGTLNESIAEAITIATNEYPEIFKVLDDDTGKYSQGEKIKAQLKYDNIQNLPENLKIMTDSVMGEYQQYLDGVQNDKLFKDEAYESKFQDGFKGVSLSVDDNGLPVSIFRNGAQDTNGDGVIDGNDIETLNSLNDVFSRPQFQKKFNYDNLINGHVAKLKSAKTDDVNGFTTTTKTGVEVDLLQKSVERVLYNSEGRPTDIMKSFLKDRGLENTPDNLKKVEETYKNDVFIRTDRGKKIDRNESAIVANKKLNSLQDRDNTGISFVENIPDEDGKRTHMKRYAFNSPYVIKGTSKSDRPKTLSEIRYDRHNDKVILIGKEYYGNETTRTVEGNSVTNFTEEEDDKKTTTSKKEDEWRSVQINDKAEVTSILSKVMGLNSYDDIVNQLRGTEKEIKEEENTQSSSKKTIEGF